MNTKGIGKFLEQRNTRIKTRYSELKKDNNRDEVLEILCDEEKLAPSTITSIVSRKGYCSKIVPNENNEQQLLQ